MSTIAFIQNIPVFLPSRFLPPHTLFVHLVSPSDRFLRSIGFFGDLVFSPTRLLFTLTSSLHTFFYIHIHNNLISLVCLSTFCCDFSLSLFNTDSAVGKTHYTACSAKHADGTCHARVDAIGAELAAGVSKMLATTITYWLESPRTLMKPSPLHFAKFKQCKIGSSLSTAVKESGLLSFYRALGRALHGSARKTISSFLIYEARSKQLDSQLSKYESRLVY